MPGDALPEEKVHWYVVTVYDVKDDAWPIAEIRHPIKKNAHDHAARLVKDGGFITENEQGSLYMPASSIRVLVDEKEES